MAKQYGGWYDDPSSGYNRRWWGFDANGNDIWGEYGVQIGGSPAQQPAQQIAQQYQPFDAESYTNAKKYDSIRI